MLIYTMVTMHNILPEKMRCHEIHEKKNKVGL